MADKEEATVVQETPEVKADAPAKADTAEKATTAPAAGRRKKSKRSVPTGQMHILATFNNTIVTFTDPKGGVLTWASAGVSGFRGSKKGTAYAAQVATEKAGTAVKQAHGLTKVDVFVKGTGLGREAAVRSLINLDIQVESIKDVTGIPHGGVRPRKAKRN